MGPIRLSNYQAGNTIAIAVDVSFRRLEPLPQRIITLVRCLAMVNFRSLLKYQGPACRLALKDCKSS